MYNPDEKLEKLGYECPRCFDKFDHIKDRKFIMSNKMCVHCVWEKVFKPKDESLMATRQKQFINALARHGYKLVYWKP